MLSLTFESNLAHILMRSVTLSVSVSCYLYDLGLTDALYIIDQAHAPLRTYTSTSRPAYSVRYYCRAPRQYSKLSHLAARFELNLRHHYRVKLRY